MSAFWLHMQRTPLPPQLRFATDALMLAVWMQVGRSGGSHLSEAPPVYRVSTPPTRTATSLPTRLPIHVSVWPQVSLGVTTLLYCVPVHLGSAHQAGALTLFSVVLFTMHSCRVPLAGRMAARTWGAAREAASHAR